MLFVSFGPVKASSESICNNVRLIDAASYVKIVEPRIFLWPVICVGARFLLSETMPSIMSSIAVGATFVAILISINQLVN